MFSGQALSRGEVPSGRAFDLSRQLACSEQASALEQWTTILPFTDTVTRAKLAFLSGMEKHVRLVVPYPGSFMREGEVAPAPEVLIARCLGKVAPPSQENRALWRGMERRGDNLVIERLNALFGAKPHLRIAEVGCGPTFSVSSKDYGSPWLSRGIKAIWGSRVTVIASDRDTQASNYYEVVLGCCGETLLGIVESNLRQPLLSRSSVGEISPNKDLAERYSSILAPDDAKLWSSPHINPVFEHEVFGITYLEGVDMHAPDPLRAHGPYDLIFGRHLEGRVASGKYDELLGLLSLNGELLLQSDFYKPEERVFHAKRLGDGGFIRIAHGSSR